MMARSIIAMARPFLRAKALRRDDNDTDKKDMKQSIGIVALLFSFLLPRIFLDPKVTTNHHSQKR